MRVDDGLPVVIFAMFVRSGPRVCAQRQGEATPVQDWSLDIAAIGSSAWFQDWTLVQWCQIILGRVISLAGVTFDVTAAGLLGAGRPLVHRAIADGIQHALGSGDQ